jgi:cyclophilin family peptidyl-prolyl cis-trans isomerase
MSDKKKAGSTIVSIKTNSPLITNTFSIELFDDPTNSNYLLTEVTANNFLDYVNSDAYDNSIIHRLVKDFVIQGGGFVYEEGIINQIRTNPPINNEPGNSNLIWTIAMAKLAGDPDSATSQWFINLADNTSLDTQNGGFTVFGRLLDDSISIINEMSSTNIYDGSVINGAFSTLPLWQYEEGAPKESEYLLVEEIKVIGIKVGSFNNNFVADQKGFSSISAPAPVTVTAYEVGTETTLDSIKDYDGNLHAGDNLEETASSYKYQGMLDVNGDGVFEAILPTKFLNVG